MRILSLKNFRSRSLTLFCFLHLLLLKNHLQWHKDPNSSSAWNTPLTGRKAWLMLPDHITPPGVYVSEDESEVTAPLSIAEWMLNFYQETLDKHGPKGDGCLKEGICNPGETMFVPKGWWHAVINLEGESNTELRLSETHHIDIEDV